ncbi:hypothetical protein KAH94_00595 [bacterium]|nr:hypothetical protein [bacterium]
MKKIKFAVKKDIKNAPQNKKDLLKIKYFGPNGNNGFLRCISHVKSEAIIGENSILNKMKTYKTIEYDEGWAFPDDLEPLSNVKLGSPRYWTSRRYFPFIHLKGRYPVESSEKLEALKLAKEAFPKDFTKNIIYGFKKHLKNKEFEDAKLTLDYLKGEAAKKGGKDISEKLLKQFEKQLKKAKLRKAKLEKQLEKAKRLIGEDTLYDSFDKSMVIQVLYEFKKNLKKKKFGDAKLNIEYLKFKVAKKEGKYIPEKLLKQLEKQLEKHLEKAKLKKAKLEK